MYDSNSLPSRLRPKPLARESPNILSGLRHGLQLYHKAVRCGILARYAVLLLWVERETAFAEAAIDTRSHVTRFLNRLILESCGKYLSPLYPLDLFGLPQTPCSDPNTCLRPMKLNPFSRVPNAGSR